MLESILISRIEMPRKPKIELFPPPTHEESFTLHFAMFSHGALREKSEVRKEV